MTKIEELLKSKSDNADVIIKHLNLNIGDNDEYDGYVSEINNIKKTCKLSGSDFEKFMLGINYSMSNSPALLKIAKEMFVDNNPNLNAFFETWEKHGEAIANYRILRMLLENPKIKNSKLSSKEIDYLEKILVDLNNHGFGKPRDCYTFRHDLKNFIISQKKSGYENKKNIVFDKYKNKLSNESKIDSAIETLMESLDITSNKNSREIETIKAIQRFFKKITLDNKDTPVLKDTVLMQAKKIADEKSTSKKKAIEFVNDIYGNNNKITYRNFIAGLKKYDIKQDEPLFVDKDEDNYQTTQRFMGSPDKNKTFVALKAGSSVPDIIEKYKNAFPKATKEVASLAGHFGDALAFVRTTKIAENWVHIDAIQTDFFNQVRKIGSENKDAKSFITEILGKEESTYKAAVSKVKNIYKNAKIWTMNTPEMASKAEMIQSGDKLSSLYSELPPKLGFKKITLDKLSKIIDTRGIKSSEMYSFKNILASSAEISLSKKELDTIIATIISHVKEMNVILKKTGGLKSVLDRKMTEKLIRTIEGKDEFFKDLSHQISIEMSDYEKKEDGTNGYLMYKNEAMDIGSIKNIIKLVLEKKNTGALKDIWWANRDMLNEDSKEFTKIIQEYIRS